MQRPLVVPFFLLCTAIPVFSQSAPFGISAAVAPDAVLVSRTDETTVGAVLVFQENPATGWQLAGELTASDGKVGDYFGYFVQAHGDRVFVGAPSAVAGQGAIYVFERSPTADGWAEVAKLTGKAEDQIGASMAISDRMIITGGLAGGAYVTVFTQTGESWQRTQTVTAVGLADNWGFGVGLAADAERLYVGAPLSNHGNGAVYVFSLEDFREETVLTSSDSAHVALGASLVSAGAGILLAGAPGIAPETQPSGPPPPGAVLEFKRSDSGTWTQGTVMFGNKDGITDLYGSSMALDESLLLIGAAAAGWFKGRLYTFERDQMGGWTVRDRLYKDGDMGFGLALDLAGDTLVVTAHPSSQGVGAAYVFRNVDGAWVLAGKLLSGEEPPEPGGADIGMVASDGPSECTDGIAWLFSCSNVDLLAFLPLSEVGGGFGVTAADVWGWTDPDTGREYALLGRSNGTAFIDVTDPENPVYLGSLPLPDIAGDSQWRDIKVYSNHAFVVAEGRGKHGMQVFDLTQLRSVESVPTTFKATARYDGIHTAHNIVINEDTGFAYAVGSRGGGRRCGGGLHMVNIRDPLNPSFAGCFAHEEARRSRITYSHDAQCVVYDGPDAEHVGKEICLGSNVTVLSKTAEVKNNG